MINLRITEAQFDELYPDLAGSYRHFDEPPPAGLSKEEFENKYLSSKLWRLNNIYKVIDKHGNPVVFRMNLAQHKVYAKSREHPRVLILKSRQQGISTLWLVSYCDDAIFAPYLNVGLMAQGTGEASTLLERVKFLLDELSDDIKSFLNLIVTKDNTKEVGFNNNSTIFIRVSFRSTTLQRLHVSEMGKIANNYPQRAKEVKTGTLQALARGNTGIIESTAEGRNMFKDMWDAAMIALGSGTMTEKDFYPIFLSWLDDPDCKEVIDQAIDSEAETYFEKLEQDTGRVLTKEQKNFWVVQRRELAGDIFQEYPATPEEAFRASRDGTYYSKLFNERVLGRGRVIRDLHDKNLETSVYFDLGVDDYTVLGFKQQWQGEHRVTREYWNNGYGIEHYLNYILDTGIDIDYLILPHDAKQRTIATQGEDQAKSTEDIVRAWIRQKRLPWKVRVLARSSVESGITATRTLLEDLFIDAKCSYLMDCLNNYTKEWDPKLQKWKTTPVHDEYSHGADVLRQMAVDVRSVSTTVTAPPPRHSSGYAV